jgi:hypothetical protein
MDANAVDWLELAGFAPEAVRGLRRGRSMARNLQTGGQSAGSVF